MSKIPEDILQAARSTYRSLETAWMKGMAEDLTSDDIVKIAVAINAERERGQLKLGQAYQVIADLLMQVDTPPMETTRVLDYFASEEFDPDFLPWPQGKIESDDAGCLARVPPPGARLTRIPEAANDNLPPVVAFTGQAGAGKSTASRYLVERHGYTLVKFAAPLKNMMRAIGLTEEHIEGDLKETPSDLLCGKTPRHAMQTIGTEWGRKCIGDDFWIRLWLAEAAKHERVVTDDCRFPNEAAAVRKAGGDIILIAGRGGIAGGHESERGCGQYDVMVDNAGGLGELERRIEEAIRRYG